MKCGVSVGVTPGQRSTRITAGIVHYENKLKFPWMTVHQGLQVCTGGWSADALFPAKREGANEGRRKFKVTHSWQFLKWVNEGAVQEQQCVLHEHGTHCCSH